MAVELDAGGKEKPIVPVPSGTVVYALIYIITTITGMQAHGYAIEKGIFA